MKFSPFFGSKGVRAFQRKTTKVFLLLVLVLGMPLNAKSFSQDKISLDFQNASLPEVLEAIENQTAYHFFYQTTLLNDQKTVSIKTSQEELHEVLNKLLKGSGLTYEIVNKQIVLKPIPLQTTNPDDQEDQRTVEGIVRDQNGVPLLGATVIEKGTSSGTMTNAEGEFRLQVEENAILLISYVGFQTAEVPVAQQTFIDVQLEPAVGELTEVVLVGYGTNEKKDIVGSIGTVEMEIIESQSPLTNVDNALQGQVPGVYVTSANGQPGAPARIRIRGTTSLWGSNQPLYVIDGIPVVANSNIPVGGTEGSNLGMELDQRGLNTPIGNISANDIKSISILKDASAGAIYGSRAANGVIIIETKSGAFGQEPQFTVDFAMSTSSPKTLEVLNAEQFREVTTRAVEAGTINNAYTRSVLDGTYFGDVDTNWEEELAPSSPVSTFFDLGAQGGTENLHYYGSIGANTQAGAFEGSGFDRYSLKLNMDSNINEIWNFGILSSLSYTDQQALDGDLTDRMYNFRPDVPVRDEDGNFSFSPNYSFANPVALSKARNLNETLLVLASFFTELEITEELSAKTMLSVNYNNGMQKSFYPRFTFRGGWSRFSGDGDGYAQESRSNYSNVMWENTLRYNDTFDEVHEIDAVAGVSFEETTQSFVKGWGEGFFNDVLTNVSSATLNRDAASHKSQSGLASYFGRINYDYESRYLLSLSGRVDGSSKFAKENKYAFFPAAGAGWRISEEAFLADVKSLDDLKIRTSWGITGQQDFGPYQWRTLFETSDYGGEPAVIISQLGNDILKWERTEQFDLGIDYSLFDFRVNGSLGYYVKNTEDAIFPVNTPGNTGFTTVLANVGDTRNSGFEFQLDADIFRREDFKWNLGFNASINRNRLVSISDDFEDEEGYIVGFGGGGRLKEGSPIGLLYGYVADGLFQDAAEIEALNQAAPGGAYQDEDTAPGDIRFKDISGPEGVPDGVIDSFDQTVIGDTQPEFFGGFTNFLSYKGFSLRTLFTYSVGNDLHWFNQARSINFSSTFLGENKTVDVLNAWTPENPTSQPRVVYGDPNNNDRISSYYVHDASYLRMKSVNLTYNFSEDFLNRFDFLRSASIYVIGQNLLTFTDYPGADPEATNLYNNDISSGRDNNRYPISKVFTAGIKVGF